VQAKFSLSRTLAAICSYSQEKSSNNDFFFVPGGIFLEMSSFFVIPEPEQLSGAHRGKTAARNAACATIASIE
jgi:hypothetical protein